MKSVIIILKSEYLEILELSGQHWKQFTIGGEEKYGINDNVQLRKEVFDYISGLYNLDKNGIRDFKIAVIYAKTAAEKLHIVLQSLYPIAELEVIPMYKAILQFAESQKLIAGSKEIVVQFSDEIFEICINENEEISCIPSNKVSTHNINIVEIGEIFRARKVEKPAAYQPQAPVETELESVTFDIVKMLDLK